MAETAVHFSVTTQIKPTIFEIIAQESLAATIDPAFKKLIEVIVEHFMIVSHFIFYF